MERERMMLGKCADVPKYKIIELAKKTSKKEGVLSVSVDKNNNLVYEYNKN